MLAFNLVKKPRGRLTCLFIDKHHSNDCDSFSKLMNILEHQTSDGVHSEVTRFARKFNVYEDFHVLSSTVSPGEAASYTRYSDLVILPLQKLSEIYSAYWSSANLSACSGIPCIFIPDDISSVILIDTALIVWEDSLFSLRLVSEAIPLLKNVSKVYFVIITASTNPEESKHACVVEVSTYLTDHGINADVETFETCASGSSQFIIEQAQQLRVGIIIMQAHGNQSVYGFAADGVTHYILEHTNIPVFLLQSDTHL